MIEGGRTLFSIVGFALCLSACAGVPRLGDRPSVGKIDEGGRPKVESISHEIACELIQYKVNHARDAGPGFKQSYLISVTLSIQVDDYANLSPSLSFIHAIPLPTTNSGTRALGIAADLDGQRERTFTETYYLYSEKFPAIVPAECDAQAMQKLEPPLEFGPGKLYTLRGDLDLKEIIRDGETTNLWSENLKQGGSKGALVDLTNPAVVTESSKKAIPSFGSTVEFIVTKSLNSFGPTWTLTKFKGVGGSNGLVNGKTVKTDKLVITFTPNPEPSDKLDAKSQASQSDLDKAVKAKNEFEARVSSKIFLSKTETDERSRLENAVTNAENIHRDDENKRISTRQLQQADVLQSAQQLQTTMILQSLNIQPR